MAFFGSSESAPSLSTSIRSFARVAIAIFHTRVDLATTELGEEAFRILYLVLAVVIGVFALHGAFFFLMLWVLAACWDSPYRLWVIGAIFLAYFLVTLCCFVIARKMILSRPRFMGQTIAELKKDVDGLQAAIKTQAHQP